MEGGRRPPRRRHRRAARSALSDILLAAGREWSRGRTASAGLHASEEFADRLVPLEQTGRRRAFGSEGIDIIIKSSVVRAGVAPPAVEQGLGPAGIGSPPLFEPVIGF